MRSRDLSRLEAGAYDVLVVGGGIHGLAIAYEASSRGLRTALIEADDFGSGASSNHQKTAHGGLRSLQGAHIGQARQAIYERRALARIAPWFLRPLPFIIGTYRSAVRSRLALRAAFKFDAWLGRHRNAGVEPELHLPPPRLVSKAATLRLFPGVRPERLTGGAQWYDYQMVEADRLTFAVAAAADRAAADLANHTAAVEIIRDGQSIAGVVAEDRLSGGRVSIRAAAVVNAAGARAGDVMRLFGVNRTLPLLKAMNVVTSKRASDIALAAPAPDGRMLTLVPWRGRALVGTSQSSTTVQPGAATVTAGELEAFIREINAAFRALQLSPSDVTLVHRGLVPAVVDRDGRPHLRSTPEIIDHSSEGAPRAFTAIGVKYTTARAMAERTVNLVARRLGKRLTASRTATTPLPGAAIADHEALAIETARALQFEVPLATIRHLIGRYAEASPEIIRLMHAREDLRAPIDPGHTTLAAEVPFVIRHEMAHRLGDIVVRRTGLGDSGHPGRGALERCAELAAEELGWDDARIASEINAVEELYRVR
jgi:glycerol-3-phosphate dehydrogenase